MCPQSPWKEVRHCTGQSNIANETNTMYVVLYLLALNITVVAGLPFW